jgi:hypothetical protein
MPRQQHHNVCESLAMHGSCSRLPPLAGLSWGWSRFPSFRSRTGSSSTARTAAGCSEEPQLWQEEHNDMYRFETGPRVVVATSLLWLGALTSKRPTSMSSSCVTYDPPRLSVEGCGVPSRPIPPGTPRSRGQPPRSSPPCSGSRRSPTSPTPITTSCRSRRRARSARLMRRLKRQRPPACTEEFTSHCSGTFDNDDGLASEQRIGRAIIEGVRFRDEDND